MKHKPNRTRQPVTLAVLDRFLPNVDRSGACWLWKGTTDKDGYGVLTSSRRQLRAHRVAYEFAFDESPGNMCVCHRCDNRRCVRPDHLFLGTNADNVADMMHKGRHSAASGDLNGSRTKPGNLRRGSAHGIAKLNEGDVRSIRNEIALGKSQASLARKHGVNADTIHKIATGQTWRHVT